jgi:hypothetical protein
VLFLLLASVPLCAQTVTPASPPNASSTQPATADSKPAPEEPPPTFIKAYFHAEWPNRSVYHAMVNTGAGDEPVVQDILSFLRQPLSTGLVAD